MKAGDLVKIVWTEGVDGASLVSGIVTKMLASKGPDLCHRQRVKIFSNGKLTWFERGDLEVVSEGR